VNKTIWLTVPLFGGQVIHVDEVRVWAHESYEEATAQAMRNVGGARDAGYRDTSTAVFEVEIGGHGAGPDILIVDKDLTHA